MNTVLWLMVATTVAAAPPVNECKSSTPRQDDCLCDILFSRYIRGGSKASTNTVRAAIDLLTWHGRRNGYWKIILEELRKGNRSERRCVTVLGKMLALDAQGRAILALSGEEKERVASSPGVALGEEVVLELLKRAQEADRFLLDFYVIALAQARDRRAVDFLAGIILPSKRPVRFPSTRFHAAEGLTNLGDKRGVEWLIDHLDDNAAIFNGPPGLAHSPLGTCCARVLKYRFEQPNLSSKAAWRAWWDQARTETARTYPITLDDH